MTGRPSNPYAMKAVLAIVASFALLTGIQSPARGSDEWSFEALQPIWTDNHVTVLTFSSGETGIYVVLATCDSNRVITDYGPPQQRNAAFEVGLRAEVTYNSNKELFGDTLRVILRATKPPVDLGDFSYATIVAATAQCILVNAAQSTAIRFVALRIDGEAPYTKYGGVFATARYRNGPRQREFRDP